MAFGIDDVLGAGLQILNKVIPDPEARAKAELELFKLKQEGEFKELEAQLQIAKGQADVNVVEASNSNLFVSGWRPAIGWVCAAALSYQYVGRPLLMYVNTVMGYAPPVLLGLDDTLMELLFGMLGLGGLRTFEKVKGVAK